MDEDSGGFLYNGGGSGSGNDNETNITCNKRERQHKHQPHYQYRRTSSMAESEVLSYHGRLAPKAGRIRRDGHVSYSFTIGIGNVDGYVASYNCYGRIRHDKRATTATAAVRLVRFMDIRYSEFQVDMLSGYYHHEHRNTTATISANRCSTNSNTTTSRRHQQ